MQPERARALPDFCSFRLSSVRLPDRIDNRVKKLPTALSLPMLAFVLAPLAAGAAMQPVAEIADLSLEQLTNVTVTSASRREERLLDAPGVDLRDHRRGHPPLGRHHHPGGSAPRPQPAGRAHRYQPVRDQRARGFSTARQQDAGDDRRAHGLHAAVLGRLLGRAGRAARGHRAHRGHQRPGRHALGHQCGQRRDQHHHQVRGPDAAGDGRRGRGRHAARRQRAHRRHPRRDGGTTAPTPSISIATSAGSRRAALHATAPSAGRRGSAPTGTRGTDVHAAGRRPFGKRRPRSAGERPISGGNVLARWQQRLGGRCGADACRPTTTAPEREHPGTLRGDARHLRRRGAALARARRPAPRMGRRLSRSRDRTEVEHSTRSFLPRARTLGLGQPLRAGRVKPLPRLQRHAGPEGGAQQLHRASSGCPTCAFVSGLRSDHVFWGALSHTVRAPSRVDRDAFRARHAAVHARRQRRLRVGDRERRGGRLPRAAVARGSRSRLPPSTTSFRKLRSRRRRRPGPRVRQRRARHHEGIEGWGDLRSLRATGAWCGASCCLRPRARACDAGGTDLARHRSSATTRGARPRCARSGMRRRDSSSTSPCATWARCRIPPCRLHRRRTYASAGACRATLELSLASAKTPSTASTSELGHGRHPRRRSGAACS